VSGFFAMNAGIRQYVQNALGRDEANTVTLVSPRRNLLDGVKSALKEEKRFQVVTIQGNLSEVQSHFGSGVRSQVLIADLRDDIEASIPSIETLRKGGFNGAVIVISDTLDEATLRGMLRFHVADWLPADAETAEVIAACERALNAQRSGEGQSRAQCLAFVPAAGGVGTTSLAIQAAYLLASRTREFSRACLVDLNLQSGCLADYLDLEPLFDADAIRGEPGRLDARLLEMMLARHASGLAVLAAARTPTEDPRADGQVVTTALSAVSDMFRYMVLDFPLAWQEWSFNVLAGSDQIYVVTEFTVPAMRRARELCDAIVARFGGERSTAVIVNKFRQRWFGGGLRKTDASELLGNRLAGFVSEDAELVSEAINRGEIISTIDRSNRVSRDLARILLKT
jgi:pilus assembly protein CpaE